MLRTRGRDPDRPRHQDRLALLLLGFGALCTATIVLRILVLYGLRTIPLALAGAWVSNWLWTGVPSGFLLALLLFPTGDVPGPRWRWAVRGVAVAFVAMWAATAFAPGSMADFPGHPNPLG